MTFELVKFDFVTRSHSYNTIYLWIVETDYWHTDVKIGHCLKTSTKTKKFGKDCSKHWLLLTDVFNNELHISYLCLILGIGIGRLVIFSGTK